MRFSCALAAAAASVVASPLAAQNPTESSATKGLDEIIVTARHREENLQKIPVAASVVDGDLLDRSHTVNTQQLSQLVPSLYYNSANPRNTAYTIRGLGSNTLSISAANDGIEPGVGFYVDQVYHGRPATASFDFTDIERVEVLRGPQGTLFGKNTTAGAIHIISRAPTFEPESNAEVSVGDYDFMQAKGSVSGPFGEKIAGRLSAQSTQREGLLYNVTTGEKLNELDNYAVRGQLLVRAERSPRSSLDRRRFRSQFSLLHSGLPPRRPKPTQSRPPVSGAGRRARLRAAQPQRLRPVERHRRAISSSRHKTAASPSSRTGISDLRR